MRAPQPLLFVGWQLFCDFLDQVPKRFRRQAGEGLNDCGMLAQTAFCEHGIPPHSGGWIADGWKIPCSPIIVNRLYLLSGTFQGMRAKWANVWLLYSQTSWIFPPAFAALPPAPGKRSLSASGRPNPVLSAIYT